jgi:hypothetical protein
LLQDVDSGELHVASVKGIIGFLQSVKEYDETVSISMAKTSEINICYFFLHMIEDSTNI